LAPAPHRIHQGSSPLRVDLGQGNSPPLVELGRGSSPSACRPHPSQLAVGERGGEKEEAATPIRLPQLTPIRPPSLCGDMDHELRGDLDLRLWIRLPQLTLIRPMSLCDDLDLRLRIRQRVGLLPPRQPPPGPQGWRKPTMPHYRSPNHPCFSLAPSREEEVATESASSALRPCWVRICAYL
jgi:hypothetical protein